jgi:hypothetical protein
VFADPVGPSFAALRRETWREGRPWNNRGAAAVEEIYFEIEEFEIQSN